MTAGPGNPIDRQTFGVGGAALSALVAGPEDGDMVVLLHGMPSSAELWRGVVPRLAEAGLRAVAFDLPGYGQTLVPARADHSLAGAAELLATWMRIEIGRGLWLVGHDLGGGVAQIIASRHPTLLSRLTLTNTVAGDNWPVPPIRLARGVARIGLYAPLAAVLGRNPYVKAQLRKGFADPSRLDGDVLTRVFLDSKVSDGDGRRAFARHLVSLDPAQTSAALGNLSRLTIPTQLIWGAQDPFFPWDTVGQRLQNVLPAPDVAVLDDAGHFCPVERPDRFAEALLGWDPPPDTEEAG